MTKNRICELLADAMPCRWAVHVLREPEPKVACRTERTAGKLNWRRMAYGMFLLCLTTAIASPAQTFTTLDSFAGNDGANPLAGLVQATNGNLYGTTDKGGRNGEGTVFKITPKGRLTRLHSFSGKDGANPVAELLQASDGNLYGTTWGGGGYNSGTVFKITPGGKLTTLYSFAGMDGARPVASLVQGGDGNLYGTTWEGGDYGNGTVFKIDLNGKLTTLHSFCSQSNFCADGGNPAAGLVQAANGNLYGTTFGFGGGACGGNQASGTVFKIAPTGKVTTLHTFILDRDGACPEAGLVQAANGNFYGTTSLGGNDFWDGGFGTVFKITPSGKLTPLYRFCDSDCKDGAYPSELIRATDGNLYGSTSGLGANYPGVLFKITPSGKLTMLYRFCSQPNCADGDGAGTRLFQATDGNFYGTTFRGGANGFGTVFRLSP